MRFADKTAIYIPLGLTGIGKPIEQVAQIITGSVGGVSITEIRGGYVMAAGNCHYERLCKYEWWHEGSDWITTMVKRIARELILEHDEESVLVEFTRGGLTEAHLLLPADISEWDNG